MRTKRPTYAQPAAENWINPKVVQAEALRKMTAGFPIRLLLNSMEGKYSERSQLTFKWPEVNEYSCVPLYWQYELCLFASVFPTFWSRSTSTSCTVNRIGIGLNYVLHLRVRLNKIKAK